jgi:hypothetical protein
MLNIRGFGSNSHYSVNGAGILAVVLLSLLTLSFSTTSCGTSNVEIFGANIGSTTAPDSPAESSGPLVNVWSRSSYTKLAQSSPLDFADWRKQNRVFDYMAAFAGGELTLTTSGQSEEIPRTSVTSGFFEALAAKPLLGRVFTLADEEPGSDEIVILSYALWQRHFHSDAGIVGKQVSFKNENFTVVGVMREGFDYPGKSDLPPDFSYQSHTEAWTPLALKSMQLGRGVRVLSVIARLRSGVTLSAAQKEMDAIANRMQTQSPETNKGWGVELVALKN